MQVADRFWGKVEKSPECWEWSAYRYPNGYGMFTLLDRKVQAHRFAYELEVAPIAAGEVIDHVCRNRACVNPAHLRVCSQRDNLMADGSESLAKLNAEKTHCVNGHEFTDENTHWRTYRGFTTRECRACKRERMRRYRSPSE